MQYSYRTNYTWLMLMIVLLAAGLWWPVAAQAQPQACPGTLDYSDYTYGGQLRQLYEPAGHEHNLYHYRTPWNADNSYMIGVKEDLNNANWKVVLYDGDGCFIKELFPITEYGWQLVWDRHDPNILYTWRSTKLYRYHVDTGQAELLKDYKLSGDAILVPPSLNQAGDRIMVVTSGKVFRSYLLPSMTEERAFTVPDLPSNCDMRNSRYIAYQNYIAVDCRNNQPWGSSVLDDDGTLLHHASRNIGHTDFSPNGKWAYFTVLANNTVEIHVVNIDGTNDQLLYSQQGKYQNLHITWPDAVSDWFIVGFFSSSFGSPPPTYTSPYDEILKEHVDGTEEWLARTRTVDTPGKSFWSQPQAAASADGGRIAFNGDCFNGEPLVDCTDSATIDQYILFTEAPVPVPVPPVAEANGPYGGKLGSSINFSSVGSTDPDGNIMSYSWDFGDSTPPSNQPNPAHAYSTVGAFTVTLKVVDGQGAIDSDTATVTISPNKPTAGRK